MVAATNPAINNVIAKALNASPASQASTPQSANVNSVAGNPADDNEFTSLLNIFLGDNADATSASGDNAATAKTIATGKDEKKADGGVTAATTPQWLITPLAIPAAPAAAVTDNATPAADGGTNAVAALAPAGGSATNALLAQNLKQNIKQLSDDKKDSTDVADKQSGTAIPEFLLNKQDDQSALAAASLKQDVALQEKALSAVTDKGKDAVQSSNDSSNQGLNTLQQMANLQTSAMTNNAPPAAQYQIHAEMGSHQWSTEVGNQLSLMVSHNVKSASLQLTPDNLGPVQVKIDVTHNQASVWFTADHPDTRTALEQSLPQLRQLFASQGMSLMDAGVFGQGSQQQPTYVAPPPQFSSGITHINNEATVTQQVLKIGLLDTYA